MAELVTQEGGWVVSVQNHPELTIQTLADSDLPEMLEGLGYTLASAGSTERLLPVAGGVAPVTVEIFQFTMPQLLAEKPEKRRKVIVPAS
jgi:hypothetical protein